MVKRKHIFNTAEGLESNNADTRDNCNESQANNTLEVNTDDDSLSHPFQSKWNNSDAILVVNDNIKFHIHSSILSLASPVFKKMFDGSSKEIVMQGRRDENIIEIFLKLICNTCCFGKVTISYFLYKTREMS